MVDRINHFNPAFDYKTKPQGSLCYVDFSEEEYRTIRKAADILETKTAKIRREPLLGHYWNEELQFFVREA
jgi:hypothetical protein